MNRQVHNKFRLYQTAMVLKTSFLAFLTFFFVVILQGATDSNIVTMAVNATQEDIQGTLDHSPAGSDILLPPGIFEITHPLIMRRDHISLRGSGPTTILHLADKANCPVVILGSPMGLLQHPTTDLRLAHLEIDGNRLNQQAEFWRSAVDGSQLNNNGVDIWDVNDSTVEGVVCRGCRSGGLVTAGTKRLTVHDFTAFDNQFDGLACYMTEECHFSDLHLHDNLGAGISLDLSFNHNVITDAEITANDLGVFMRNSKDNIFQGLTISRSKNHGVFMAQTAKTLEGVWKLCPGTECTGNKFEGLTITNCGGKAFWIKDPGCKDNTVKEAKFVANSYGNFSEPEGASVRVEDWIQR